MYYPYEVERKILLYRLKIDTHLPSLSHCLSSFLCPIEPVRRKRFASEGSEDISGTRTSFKTSQLPENRYFNWKLCWVQYRFLSCCWSLRSICKFVPCRKVVGPNFKLYVSVTIIFSFDSTGPAFICALPQLMRKLSPFLVSKLKCRTCKCSHTGRKS